MRDRLWMLDTPCEIPHIGSRIGEYSPPPLQKTIFYEGYRALPYPFGRPVDAKQRGGKSTKSLVSKDFFVCTTIDIRSRQSCRRELLNLAHPLLNTPSYENHDHTNQPDNRLL